MNLWTGQVDEFGDFIYIGDYVRIEGYACRLKIVEDQDSLCLASFSGDLVATYPLKNRRSFLVKEGFLGLYYIDKTPILEGDLVYNYRTKEEGVIIVDKKDSYQYIAFAGRDCGSRYLYAEDDRYLKLLMRR